MERIYTDTYDFAKIRERGAVYVDKTAQILCLVDGSIGDQFFLARPRRFGKSLLLSTIRYIFEGRRDLFEGLAIGTPGAGWDWEGERCPVIRLDMSMCSGTMDQVANGAQMQLELAAGRVGVPLRDAPEVEDRFLRLVCDAAEASPTGKCVVLIDEYDKPLLQWLGMPEAAEYQSFLKRFYGVVKATEGLQRFCLMTGVSKFSKASIFSDLNNLVDITMHPASTTLLGYTHDEARSCFPQAMRALADELGTDAEGAFAHLASWYDGYCFDRRMVPVFNPVSLGSSLRASELRSYWFETGTPGWLMSYARREPLAIDGLELADDQLGVFEPADPDISTLLFQTGYLTIKGVDAIPDGGFLYRLGFPNREVRNGFSTWLAGAYTGARGAQLSAWQVACRNAVREGDAAAFVEALESFFASIGYDLSDRLPEQAYQQVAVAILRFVGIFVSAEVTSSRGRVDMVCQSPGHVFVIELKVASGQAAGQAAADAAIAQIRERGYAAPFAADAAAGRRRVQLLGIAFDCETHNVGAWACEDL